MISSSLLYKLFGYSWTAVDAEIVCKQLGFAAPVNDYFTYNFTATDYHNYIAITQPNCTGGEDKLLNCKGAAVPKYSSQICSKYGSKAIYVFATTGLCLNKHISTNNACITLLFANRW